MGNTHRLIIRGANSDACAPRGHRPKGQSSVVIRMKPVVTQECNGKILTSVQGRVLVIGANLSQERTARSPE